MIIRKPRALLPNETCDYSRWAVVACDQFTSEPEYWAEVQKIAGDAPSALNAIYPEALLREGDARIEKINRAMEGYLSDVLTREVNSYILVERETSTGKRLGIMAEIDLEAYDYAPGAKPLIRATEGTIAERVPPRVKVRENAPIELPHVMLLIDDPERRVIEPIYALRDSLEKLYDFELMLGGGHIRGWRADADAANAIEKLERDGLMLAVGDGNHSLAAARACYLKNKTEFNRWALVEIVNLYDEALAFEPIHRAFFGADGEKLARDFERETHAGPGDAITFLWKDQSRGFDAPLSVAQPFFDKWIIENGAKLDYVHDEEALARLIANGAVGARTRVIEKAELFPSVVKYGALPRKAFSMGRARDKRYYLEGRRLK